MRGAENKNVRRQFRKILIWRKCTQRGNAVKLLRQQIHRKLRWNREELFAVLNDRHWKLTVAGAYSAFLTSARRLNVSSGVFGPLFLIKQRRLIPVYMYIPLSFILVSRNSFICSLDRKKCPLVHRHFYLSCPVPPSSFFAYHAANSYDAWRDTWSFFQDKPKDGTILPAPSAIRDRPGR